MIPSVRDALLRLGSGSDYKLAMEHVAEQRGLLLESLGTVDPSDTINIARIQGRISTYDVVLNLVNEAVEAADTKGTNDG